MTNNFKVGEKVVALKDSVEWSSQKRISGEVYTVHMVKYCEGCGKQLINIGQSFVSEYDGWRCKCGSPVYHRGFGWTKSEHFTRPISHEYKLEVAIPELLEIKIPQLQ